MTKSTDKLLTVTDLSVRFPLKGRDAEGKRKTLLAVDNVSFEIERGKTLGIVGESRLPNNAQCLTAFNFKAYIINCQQGLAFSLCVTAFQWKAHRQVRYGQ